MVQTTVELVYCSCERVVAIHKVQLRRGPNCLFSPVTYMLDSVYTDGTLLRNKVFVIIKPLNGFQGMVYLGASLSTQRLNGDGVGGQVIFAPEEIACACNSIAFDHRVKSRFIFKFTLKGLTTSF